jgi:hypothetical protein
MKRRTIAIIVLAGGAFSAFLIARLAASPGESGAFSLLAENRDDPAFAFGEARSGAGNAIGGATGTNLTEQVVQRYGEEVLKLNQRGSSGSSVALPPEGTLENFIADTLEQPLSVTLYTARDLHMVPLTNLEELAAYFDTLVDIQHTRFDDLEDPLLTAIARFVETESVSPLESQRSAIAAYLGDILSLAVPSPLETFHLGLVNLWQKRLAYTIAILESENDPLKVVAATSALAKTADEETGLLTVLVTDLENVKL